MGTGLQNLAVGKMVLPGNKYAEYFFGGQMIIVSGTLTFVGVRSLS